MSKTIKPFAALILSILLSLSAAVPALGATPAPSKHALECAAAYLRQAVPSPTVAAIGGEWAVIGLARSGLSADRAWFDAYLQNLNDTLAARKGVLSARKYTEYARVVLALTALGENPKNVVGYNLLAPLEDFDQTVRQGLNGAIFALIALDSGHYDAPAGLRERYLQYLLDARCADGGWTLSGDQADPDITAMALQALAPYRGSLQAVNEAVLLGTARLTKLWSSGSFSTLENYAQAVVALCALDLQPDSRLLAEFLSFQRPDGSFCHSKGGQRDLMSTEQGLCALVALARQEAGTAALYDMSDIFSPQRPENGSQSDQVLRVLPVLAFLLPTVALGRGIPLAPVG